MLLLTTHRDFSHWRALARQLLVAEVPPNMVLWADADAGESLLGATSEISEMWNEATAAPGRPAQETRNRGFHAPHEPVSAQNEPTALHLASPEVPNEATAALFPNTAVRNEPTATRPAVPREFLDLASSVACHRDPDRWNLLYRSLWRLTHGERSLLERLTDDDVYRLHTMERAVRRDRHKMTAFVRFRLVASDDEADRYVAWHRPDHFIVRLTAPFFVARFATLHWTLLTPDDSATWDGKTLAFGPGVPASEAPQGDDLERLWLTYYANIFNPARVKIGAMKRELPVRHWPTLPETELIPDLLNEAPRRVQEMIRKAKQAARPGTSRPGQSQSHAGDDAAPLLPLPPDERGTAKGKQASPGTPADWGAERFIPRSLELPVLAKASKACRGCDLCDVGTQTVFGEGPPDALVMFVGEQPGDQEDRAGKPFVGPAGQLLDEVLEQVGIDRGECYVTNTVKHFKWEPRGTRRIHAKASAREVSACRPWLETEIRAVKPRMLVCLGSTAAQALLGRDFRVTQQRGQPMKTEWASWTMATIHPSALLRIPDPALRERSHQQFVEDLQLVARQAKKERGK
jgi:probable DNA metabolism protein